MEIELSCPVCHELFKDPVALPCGHNLCYNCAKTVTTAAHDGDGNSDDSGYISITELHHNIQQHLVMPLYFINCPRCPQTFGLDDRGVDSLSKNLILDSLAQRYHAKNSGIDCQLCDEGKSTKATFMCEQCQVAYCDDCLAICHPKRGPLAKHSLVPPNSDKVVQNQVKSRGVLKCTEHEEENISMYCSICNSPVCYLCFEIGRHSKHDAKALGLMFKEQKSELAKNLKVLTERNKELQKFMQYLQEHSGKLQENGVDFEARIVAQCDALIHEVEQKKISLLEFISNEIHHKGQLLKEQSEEYKENLKYTTALLQYTLEVLRESDPATFLLISYSLNKRLSSSIDTWVGAHSGLYPITSAEVDLKLETCSVLDALESLQFTQLKGPNAPEVLPEECSVTNNTITLTWKQLDRSSPDGYLIELDDGLGGMFQVVHDTDECTCTLGGLQFQSTYRARVKGYNKAGEGPPSETVYLTTPDVAVFALDPHNSHPDINLANDNLRMTCSSYENRVVLADVGFTRGRHYWEVTIEKYEGNPDPAFGIAQEDTSKDCILGKDDKSWSAYVDSTRSWFQHNNAHLCRSDGGIDAGSIVGLLVDLDLCTLTFYCNEDKRGPVEFPSLAMADVVYPAFSLNRNVTMTLHTGLEPPESDLPCNS